MIHSFIKSGIANDFTKILVYIVDECLTNKCKPFHIISYIKQLFILNG